MEWYYGKRTFPRHGFDDSYVFSPADATPGERCAIDLDMTTVKNFLRTDASLGERCAIDLDVTTVTDFPRMDATPGERCAIDLAITSATDFTGCRTVLGFSQIDSAQSVAQSVARLSWTSVGRAFRRARVARKSVTI